MKTAGFRMAFISGLVELACSKKVIQNVENNTKEEDESIVIEALPAAEEIGNDESETNYKQP